MYNQEPKRLGIAHLFIDLFEKTRSETKIDLLHVHNNDNNVIYFLLRARSFEVYNPYHGKIVVPESHYIMRLEVFTNHVYFWCMSVMLTLKKKILQPVLPNVYPEHTICWGSSLIGVSGVFEYEKTVEENRDVLETIFYKGVNTIHLYWQSKFNNDLQRTTKGDELYTWAITHRVYLNSTTVISLLQTHPEAFSRIPENPDSSYPLKELLGIPEIPNKPRVQTLHKNLK